MVALVDATPCDELSLIENSRLISAAPELLAACRAVLQMENLHDSPYQSGKAARDWRDVRDLLRVGIAKACGAAMLLMALSGCATTETRYAVEYRADATRPAEGVIVAGVSGGFSSVGVIR
jgi:hypothetical protein